MELGYVWGTFLPSVIVCCRCIVDRKRTPVIILIRNPRCRKEEQKFVNRKKRI